MQKIISFIVLIIVLISCKNDSCDDYPSTEDVNVELISYQKEYKKITSKEGILSFLNENQTLKNGFFLAQQYPDSIIVDYLYNVAYSGGIDTIYTECESTFGDFEKWKKQYEDAFSLLQYYFPDERLRTIATFIQGPQKDLHIEDTAVIVGLDYFLGPKATFRPQNYEYINKRYVPDAIVPMSMVLISTKYNRSAFDDKTLLAEMIYFGKSYYFAKSMLPCVGDSSIIGYSQDEAEGSMKNIDRIWSYFVEKEVLFETNHVEKKRYIEERPAVTEIGNKCPGRIGQWLGWQIVKAYMDNNDDVTLAQLMAEKDVKKIFDKSKFKP